HSSVMHVALSFTLYFCILCYDVHRDLHSFPTRRSSDLSKEFVREWLISEGFQGKEGQKMPEMPDELVLQISERYIELFEHQLIRSEEHTSELQSRENLVCRLLLEKKKNTKQQATVPATK